jgi:hypothetical protein
MRKIKFKYIHFAIALVLITNGFMGCDDFFETDISKDIIALVVPSNGIETDIVSQVFRWEELEGASSYRLQVVMPDFNNAEAMLLDTLISTNRFEKTLFPGAFQWRVRGENSGYKTAWTTAAFTIFATDDLTRQSIRLLNPSDNFFTNQTKVLLKWDTLYNADNYEIKAYKNNWNGSPVMEPLNTTDGNIELTVTEGEIWWGVKAVNEKSETQFTTRKFVVDLSPPVKPTLKSPLDKAELTNTKVSFSWDSNDINWTEVTDSLFIYQNTELTDVIKKVTVKEKQTTIELTSGKNYFWRVKSTDKAGNQSTFSSTFQFSIVD